MVSNLVPRGLVAALAGATLAVLASTGSSSAFTLSAPSLAQPVAAADVQHVWWDRWGRWHRPWVRRWGWGPRWGYGPGWGWGPRYYGYYGPVRRCWVGPWGGVHCRWV
jgi:hypothetical protein